MHPNFYHWHARVELKPDPAILEPRWNAAEQFAKKLSADSIRWLLNLALFPITNFEFAKHFTEALVKVEPTFPVTRNSEVLRVMAAAASYSQLEKPSNVADALALGLQAAMFPLRQIEPVCDDLVTRANEYIHSESERIRPEIDAGLIEKAEKQSDGARAALKAAVDTGNVQEIGKAVDAFGLGVFAAMKESHQQLGRVINRLTEESQFLWWIVGRRSSALNRPREKLTVETYSLTAAAEASERVALLPPAASVESLLEEALSQCGKGGRASVSFADLLQATDSVWAKGAPASLVAPELTPITSLLAGWQHDKKPDEDTLKKLSIPAKAKVSPVESAKQYYHELVFVRAMQEVR